MRQMLMLHDSIVMASLFDSINYITSSDIYYYSPFHRGANQYILIVNITHIPGLIAESVNQINFSSLLLNFIFKGLLL